MELATSIDHLVNSILLKAENQHEFLIGACQSEWRLTSTQEHILMLLTQESLTNSDLAKCLSISQAAVTKAVKGLIAQGLLESQKASSDARSNQYLLTEQALFIAQEHANHHHQTLLAYQEIIDKFSQSEQEVLSRFMEALVLRLEKSS
ncbi:zinc-dependent MarR family transcriptional regulator [Streptococcus sp. sy010]|uniref:zinc-dependent MarR family transcriptional regulator n=1 Tax=Streptococcus sp. sy010 TaxID=2600148 RepID=UPI0011B5D1B6|nr:zinc-dependent MarR family transcriptional regulator [Streptococcus sp. sy010]TWT14638.1 MarR family transcriptional regulator [Streptococcus sp. sy010]